jgi:hypothetical protein
MADRGENIPKKNSFGSCRFSKTSPVQIAADTKVINFTISFEDALRLNLAVDECVRKLNRYDRSRGRGKKTALALVIHLDKGRIRVNEGKIND